MGNFEAMENFQCSLLLTRLFSQSYHPSLSTFSPFKVITKFNSSKINPLLQAAFHATLLRTTPCNKEEKENR
jgi:hypothetical protein